MKILALNLDNYDAKYFYYLEPKTNLIMTGIFTKIIYTEPYYTINDIFYYFPIYYTHIESHNDSYIVIIDKLHPQNEVILDKIYKLETEILCNYASFMSCRKMSSMSIYNKLLSGSFRIAVTNNEYNNVNTKKHFLLKISGIWENETQFGITSKLIESI